MVIQKICLCSLGINYLNNSLIKKCDIPEKIAIIHIPIVIFNKIIK